MIRDSSGDLYGTTYYGGTAGRGVVYKLDADGHETVLTASRVGLMGAAHKRVIRDSAGNLYGTTSSGGLGLGSGVVFKLDNTGQETVLYTFTGGADGWLPLFRSDPRFDRQPLRNHRCVRHGGRGCGVQAGHCRSGNRALHLHGGA